MKYGEIFSSRLAMFYIADRLNICYQMFKKMVVFQKIRKANEEAKAGVPKAARTHTRNQELDFIKEVEHVGLVLFKTTFQRDMNASAEKREIIMITVGKCLSAGLQIRDASWRVIQN